MGEIPINSKKQFRQSVTREDNELDAIPRQDLIAMLKNAAWYSGAREHYGDHQGYSYDVQEETSIRDVIYRNEPLYKTAEEALVAHWRRHYSPND